MLGLVQKRLFWSKRQSDAVGLAHGTDVARGIQQDVHSSAFLKQPHRRPLTSRTSRRGRRTLRIRVRELLNNLTQAPHGAHQRPRTPKPRKQAQRTHRLPNAGHIQCQPGDSDTIPSESGSDCAVPSRCAGARPLLHVPRPALRPLLLLPELLPRRCGLASRTWSTIRHEMPGESSKTGRCDPKKSAAHGTTLPPRSNQPLLRVCTRCVPRGACPAEGTFKGLYVYPFSPKLLAKPEPGPHLVTTGNALQG